MTGPRIPLVDPPGTTLWDVWCSKCDKPAVRELVVTADGGKTTYTAAYCSTHIWPLIAPKGPAGRPHNPGDKKVCND